MQVHVDRALQVSFSKTFPVLVQNNGFLCMLTDLNAFSYVNAVTWSPDAKSLASASNDKTVMIWGASLEK